MSSPARDVPDREPPALGVLLAFDGVFHSSDLAVQAFARHLADALPPDGARVLIAGMRGFLEGKPDLIPDEVDLRVAEDGYQAVETLARAAGLTSARITAAHEASRADLAASAWTVDATDGLAELLGGLSGTTDIRVLTEPRDPAAPAVLDSLDFGDLDVIDLPLAQALTIVLERLETGDPARVLMIGSRWLGQLSEAGAAGCGTALIDRYGLHRGTPTLRSQDLVGLIGPVDQWRINAGRATAVSS